jgi:AraC-like DNA-binding protein
LRHATGLTSHLIPEIAIALEGRGRMDFTDQSLVFQPPAVILLPPGCPHCEAAFSARTPYSLLWLVGDRSLTTALISSFEPGRGWRTPLHRTVRCRSSLRLFARVREGVPSRSAFSPAIRRDLLDLMVRFYEGEESPVRPRLPVQPVQRYAGLLEQIRDYLDQHFTEPITLPQLAAQVHLTPRYLNRLFHRWSGEALHEFLTRRRMEEALQLCRQKQHLVKEIAAAVGYEDPLYFSRAFRRYFGRSPSET